MFHRVLTIGLFVAALAFTPAPAAGQAPGPSTPATTTGTYSYFWADASNNEITSATTVVGGAPIVAKLYIRESGGGNIFQSRISPANDTRDGGAGPFGGNDIGGIGGGDARVILTGATTGIVRLAPESGSGRATSSVILNPEFTSTFGGFAKNQIAPFNAQTNGTATTGRFQFSVTNPGDALSLVKASTVPNAILLSTFTLQPLAVGTTTLNGQQSTVPGGYVYYNPADTTTTNGYLALDSLIGSAQANLAITVNPVPEPATVLAAGSLVVGAVGVVRRRRAARAGLAA